MRDEQAKSAIKTYATIQGRLNGTRAARTVIDAAAEDRSLLVTPSPRLDDDQPGYLTGRYLFADACATVGHRPDDREGSPELFALFCSVYETWFRQAAEMAIKNARYDSR